MWALFGATGGIGSACYRELLAQGVHVVAFDRSDLDFTDTDAVSSFDLTGFTHVLNCTGTGKGTYLGFVKNDCKNILEQITVNYTSNLLLLKNFVNTNAQGHYAWIGSVSSADNRPYQGVYGSTKLATTFATKLIAKEVTDLTITEVKLGLTETNFRYKNYLGSRTNAQVAQEYSDAGALDADYCAGLIIAGIRQRLTLIEITK